MQLVDGVFLGADVKDASKVVGMGRARASDFKFFFSAVHWEKGQLKVCFRPVCLHEPRDLKRETRNTKRDPRMQAGVEDGTWVIAACSNPQP